MKSNFYTSGNVWDYRHELVDDSEFMETSIANSWPMCLEVYNKVARTLLAFKCKSRDILQDWMTKGCNVCPEELKEYEILFDNHKTNMIQFYLQFSRNLDKCELIHDTLIKYSFFGSKLEMDTRILSYTAALFRNDYSGESILNLQNPGINLQYLMERIFRNRQSDIMSLLSISTHLAGLIISEVKENKELYSLHRPEVTGTVHN